MSRAGRPPGGALPLRRGPGASKTVGMRLRSVVVGVVLAVVAGGAAHAQDAEAKRRAAVVATVGPRNITVGELEDRLAQVPPFQLRTFGATPEAVRRKFLNEVLVPETLFALGAGARHLDDKVPTRFDLDRVRADATLRALRARLGPASAIPMDEVRKYYDAHKARYDAPERYNVYRILCATREEAETVLAAAKKDQSLSTWNKLARDHSVDKATNLRGGNLGFVAPDGTSNEAGLKVDPGVVKAATTVRDGQMVPQPVPEGPDFAVVWRRGTVGASHRSVDDVKEQIQSAIYRDRVDAETKKLIGDLKTQKLKDYAPELLNGIDVAPPDGTIVPRKRPGQVAPATTP